MKTIWKRLKRYVDGDPSPVDVLTLTDPATIAGFRDLSRELRARRPVCPLSSGGVLLLEPEDVKHAFSSSALSNQPSRFSALAAKNKDKYIAASVASHILPFLDGPLHVTTRQWASRAFFRHLRDFKGQIHDIATRHCRTMDVGQSYHLVEDVARRFVVEVMGAFIGIDLCASDLKRCTSALFRLFAPAFDAETFAETNEALALARNHLGEALEARRQDLAPCLLNALDATYPDELGQDERDLQIIDNALLFLADGVENVEAAVGIVMMRYAQEPQALAEEFVRTAITADTPGQAIARIASEDIAIGGETLTAGTPVFLSLSSANDGSATGDDFTFGRGRHKCLGENLAVTMVTELCAQLADKVPDINSDKLTYRAMFGHKWPRGITVTLTR
ncbi:cytochrome P450 [Octadecabacter ascidiaceicola]|uniref:Vitamin D(3) 25-hydroxylase n=1 Tax=Octadecabacter ascidiaceicola TaxID=1655543 RepID=A0A238KHX3_9RHOB|nr:cytochrome P450 [Octadecabacter ascidiaceicola]SMX42413.1 Vitamin D(3) 25-hydroxylase [Octadecabacter ascidiaceicola]